MVLTPQQDDSRHHNLCSALLEVSRSCQAGFFSVLRISARHSGSAPLVIAARSRLLEELIGVLVGTFCLSAWSLTSPGICLLDFRTRASGSGAERYLLRGISDITSESGTSPTDRL